MGAKFSTVGVYPIDGEGKIIFRDIDMISLINDKTFGPAPVFFQNEEFRGRVLYVNPQNISAMEANK